MADFPASDGYYAEDAVRGVDAAAQTVEQARYVKPTPLRSAELALARAQVAATLEVASQLSRIAWILERMADRGA